MIKERLESIDKSFDLDISICIVSYNGKKLLEECLCSIYKNIKGLTYEVLIVDNNSSDGSVDMVKTQFSDAHIIENKTNYGFAKANNQAIRIAAGEYILLLNQDVAILDSDSIKIMKEFLDSHKGAAVCGCNYVSSDGAPQPPQFRFQTIKRLFSYYFRKLLYGKECKSCVKISKSLPQEVDVAIGACFMIKKEAIDKVGMFDEAFFFYFEEADWCFRIKRAGWKIYLLPWICVRHRFHNMQVLDIKLQYQYYRGQYLFFKKSYGRLSAFLLLAIDKIVNCLKLLYAACVYFCGLVNREKRASRFIAMKNAFQLFWLVNTMPL